MIKVCLYLQRYCIRWYNIIIVVNKKGRQMKIKVNKRIKGIKRVTGLWCGFSTSVSGEAQHIGK